jgi:hypothetical protein
MGGRKPLRKLLLLGLGIAAVAVVAGVVGMKFGENKAKAEMYDQMMEQMGAAAEEMPLGSISGQIREESQRLLGLSGIEVQVAGEVQVPVEGSSGGCSGGSCGTSSQQYETQYVEANDVTGVNGNYEIKDLPYGVYQVLVSSQKHMWICEAEVEVDGDVTMDFSIPQLSLISGYVTGPLGIAPLSGVAIEIGPSDNQAHEYDINQDGEPEYYLQSCVGNVCHYTQAVFKETTDANGYFEVYAPAGNYQIVASTSDNEYQPQVQVVTVGAGQIEPVSFSLNLWQQD